MIVYACGVVCLFSVMVLLVSFVTIPVSVSLCVFVLSRIVDVLLVIRSVVV